MGNESPADMKGGATSADEIERDEGIHEILRGEAIREDNLRTAAEQKQQLEVATRAAVEKLAQMERRRDEEAAKAQMEAEAAKLAAPPVSMPGGSCCSRHARTGRGKSSERCFSIIR
jgi:hypothetical protein